MYVCVCVLYRVELEGEIRLTVDDLMREELKNLKMVSQMRQTDFSISAD